MDAGSWWATPTASVTSHNNDGLMAQFAALGFSESDLAKMKAELEGEQEEADGIGHAFLVFADNFNAVRAFLAVASQWRVMARGGLTSGLIYLGLDYAGVKAGLRMADIHLDGPGFAKMQWIERGAVSALNGD